RNNLALASSSPTSQKECEVADGLFETIKSVKDATACHYTEETTLDVDDDPLNYSTSWFVVLACVDRYLCSSPHASVRRFSSLKVAYRAVSITAIIIWLSYIHIPIYFTIQDTLDKYSNPTSSCTSQKGLYTTFLAFCYLTMYSLCPPFLMLIFGLLALNNIRQRGKQVTPVSDSTTTATVNARRKRKTDHQLLVMLIVQCIVIALSTAPLAMQKLYVIFTASWYKDPFKLAQDNFWFTFVSCQSIVGHVLSFPLFTLSGTIFRREVMKLFGKIFKICGCYNPNVQRDGTHTQDISKTKSFWSARSNMQLTRNRVTSRE
ncbi:unnamed protein product, partial [Didymodactylos carnosus]